MADYGCSGTGLALVLVLVLALFWCRCGVRVARLRYATAPLVWPRAYPPGSRPAKAGLLGGNAPGSILSNGGLATLRRAHPGLFWPLRICTRPYPCSARLSSTPCTAPRHPPRTRTVHTQHSATVSVTARGASSGPGSG